MLITWWHLSYLHRWFPFLMQCWQYHQTNNSEASWYPLHLLHRNLKCINPQEKRDPACIVTWKEDYKALTLHMKTYNQTCDIQYYKGNTISNLIISSNTHSYSLSKYVDIKIVKNHKFKYCQDIDDIRHYFLIVSYIKYILEIILQMVEQFRRYLDCCGTWELRRSILLHSWLRQA